MMVFLYVLALLGSCSVGYSLLRIGFPEKQDSEISEKLGYSYGLGLVVFLPGIISIAMFGEKLFFIISGIIYVVAAIALYIKRRQEGLEDNVELVENKKEIRIPKKVLTDEEKEEKIDYDSTTDIKTDPTKNMQSGKIDNKIKVKEQIIKEKQPNVIAKLREKTTNVENDEDKRKKEVALQRLKGLAKKVKKKGDGELEELEDVDEKGLDNIGNMF
jgi:hypothetical protein